MASSLKIVATPIGNIRDISLRAIDEIKLADVIFAEDTRHSLKLIEALALDLKPDCRFISCDSHKETHRIQLVVEHLVANKRVLLLSDAGCPTISDPGSMLVQGVVLHGLTVEVIPGPSATTAALMGAGIDTTRFAFLGFLPQKKLVRKKLITASIEAGLALVIFESLHRVMDLLTQLHGLVGARRVVVARELTKLHETFHRGVLGGDLSPSLVEKGECVVVVEAGKEMPVDENQPTEIASFIKAELAQGVSAKDVARAVATAFKIKKNAAYDMVLQILSS
jgi:16S rRNA (cytidine1402-2'-O)-methyltransferase